MLRQSRQYCAEVSVIAADEIDPTVINGENPEARAQSEHRNEAMELESLGVKGDYVAGIVEDINRLQRAAAREVQRLCSELYAGG